MGSQRSSREGRCTLPFFDRCDINAELLEEEEEEEGVEVDGLEEMSRCPSLTSELY